MIRLNFKTTQCPNCDEEVKVGQRWAAVFGPLPSSTTFMVHEKCHAEWTRKMIEKMQEGKRRRASAGRRGLNCQ